MPGSTTEDETFRAEVADWMRTNLTGEFAKLANRGGPGDEHTMIPERMEWERHLAASGWTCVGWPTRYGGRGLPLSQEVIFHEEYARAGGPGRAGLIGEGLLGPTLIAFASEEIKARFLPGIVSGTEFWCQGYSEPNAGSDLANVKTTARLDGDRWLVTGQKVWTSLAQFSDWCFVVARSEPGSSRHHGLSYLLVPMDAPGIEVRPIQQITGTAEFNEVFFDDTPTAADLVVGQPGQGWQVAMGTLAFERGVLTLGQQMAFRRELDAIVAAARTHGVIDDPVMRQKLANLEARLRIMRWNALRNLSVDAASNELVPAAMIGKLYWANLHREMGEVAMDVLGAAAGITAADYGDHEALEELHRLFFFTRSDTIYGGTDEIQRNIIGERALGLPREPKPNQPKPGEPKPAGATPSESRPKEG
jgi:alkylation response protein AidB-like acyl-CoA dehydrogenase